MFDHEQDWNLGTDDEPPPAKYLAFVVGADEYGVPIPEIREVVRLQPLTPVPDTPPYVKGVVNLRGLVIPVVDLREKLGAFVTEDTEETCIVIMISDAVCVGAIVDRVLDVIEVPEESVSMQPPIGGTPPPAWVQGIQARGDGVRFLVDVDGLISGTGLVYR
ncbi:MAG: purine-binding chemotaxis protein CheW [Actinobacteria bacterium ATB1]|nr:purine-binding chemotaxis protein CheW [Actinobacteria bacterium ATB1]